MEDALKKRLVGAVVLISLAVIFVPMLFEDEPVVSSHISETNIPLRPVFPSIDTPTETTVATDAAAASTAPTDGGGQNFALPQPETSQGSQPPPAMVPAPTVPAARVMPPQPPAVQSSPKPEPAPTPSTVDKPSLPSGWVVQVGSFSDKTNADTSLERLRKAGYDSFMQEIIVGDKVLFRVRVGPEAERENAEKLQAQIAQSMNLQGQVQKYP